MCSLVLCQLHTHFERGNLNFKKCSCWIGLWTSLWCIVWWLLVGGSSSLWVVSPRDGGPCCYERQNEQTIRSMPVNNPPSWLLHPLLPPSSYPDVLGWYSTNHKIKKKERRKESKKRKGKKTFPPQVAYGHSVLSQQ